MVEKDLKQRIAESLARLRIAVLGEFFPSIYPEYAIPPQSIMEELFPSLYRGGYKPCFVGDQIRLEAVQEYQHVLGKHHPSNPYYLGRRNSVQKRHRKTP